MKTSEFSLIHLPSGTPVARVGRAAGWWAKGWGVLGLTALPAGRGLWLPGVASVHTLFVRFSLDLLFLDGDMKAVRVAPAVPPNTPLVSAPGARHTIELGVGTLTPNWARVGECWQLHREES